VARQWVPRAAGWAVLIGLALSVALPLVDARWQSMGSPGWASALLGDVTAMAGTCLLLVMVLLAARIPELEKVLGQDRLIRWHRWLSPAPLVLLGAHAWLTTLGFAQSSRSGFWPQMGSVITTMAWMFAAVVSYAMLVVIAGVSIRMVRRKFSYDTWWVIHLYTYLALALSIPHQIFSGTNFAGRHAVQGAWLLLWMGTAGVVVLYRIGLPLYRSVRHRLEVVSVVPEGPGVFSIVVQGRAIERLPVEGGQFFRWRFLTRKLWWHAHPFSLSAMPVPPYMRVTMKVTGDATARMARLRPGTRVAIEGPYGAFTESARKRRKVALVGAGVGITPLRALLEDFPDSVDTVVVHRASTSDHLIHRGEISSLVKERGGRHVELVGSRAGHRLSDPRKLHRIIPDLATRDLYVCGPEGFSDGVVAAARHLGVPAESIHRESFEF
jgi:predicted ferric reductase